MEDSSMFVNESNGHKFGNFHSYYTFHEQQSRTKLIPPNFFVSLWQAQGGPAIFSIIDIGCNEGNLTLELYDRAVAELPSDVCCLVLGIDLDSDLIGRAIEKSSHISNVTFCTVDVMSGEDGGGIDLIRNYCTEKGIHGFSFASLFSITMWIHLNHGDVGFEKFLNSCARLLTDVGSILVEPQPWKCYRNAVRRCRKMSLPLPKHFADLSLKDPDAAVCSCMAKTRFTAADSKRLAATDSTISVGVIGCGMTHYSPLGTEMWGRSLLVFHQSDISASGLPVLKLSQRQGSIVHDAEQEQSEGSQAKTQSISSCASSNLSNVIAFGDNFDECSADQADNPVLNSDDYNEVLNKKRKSSPSLISPSL